METVKKIIVCGMGGSGLPGYALDSYTLVERLPLRVSVWNSYDLPPLAEKSVPVFCVSYSGNTEETISNFLAARRRGHPLIAVTTGGKLAALARRYRVPIARVPTGIPPRSALGHMTGAIANALRDRRMIRMTDRAMRSFEAFDPERILPQGARLARVLANRIPLVYTSREWYAVGHIWKIAFNETAKIPAFSYTIPEANHNDMEGLIEKPLAMSGNFAALFLEFSGDHPRIKARMELSRRVWAGAGILANRLAFRQGEFWTTFFRAVGIGYSASRTIARMRKVDPNSARTIEQFKKWMAE